MSEPLVIVGNGMAAAKFAEELGKAALGRYAVAVIGDEPTLAYNRVLLSSLLAREISAADIELRSSDWWSRQGVTLLYGQRATEIDTRRKFVRLKDGRAVAFSKLVIATGSDAIRLPLPGADLPGVLTFRDRADVSEMLDKTRDKPKAIVIGGGLLGLEAAYGLHKAGAGVTLIHLMDCLMERQLDAKAGAMLRAAIEQLGITVLLNAESAAIQGRKRVGGLRLKDGRVLDADMIVMAVGIKPNVALAKTAGLRINRGIVVDDHMQSSEAGIYALGECAEHRGICYGLVEPAYEQARALAGHLASRSDAYSGSLLSTNLKVSGVNVFSAGNFLGSDGSDPIILTDTAGPAYRKLVVRDGRLTGAVLFGDTSDALWYLDLIRTSAPVRDYRDGLVFGRAFSEPAATGAVA